MVVSSELTPTPSIFSDERMRIPAELHAQSGVYVLNTIGDARQALTRLRELRRDFDIAKRACENGECTHSMPRELPGQGEDRLAGLSNIQRMRTIRHEIAYIEDLMVRIAEREFRLEENKHSSYLSGIGQWRERGSHRPVI